MDGKRTEQGRQSVRRHWKPSLGRFVELYDRTGEHARRVVKRAVHRNDDAQAQSRPNTEPRMVRRLVISVCAFGITLGVIGGFRLARQSRVAVEYDVLVATAPVVVKVDHGSARRVVTASPTRLEGLVRDAVAQVRAAAAEHPDRLIAIAPAISYDSLPASDQRAVGRDDYETAVARFLDKVVNAVADPRVGILAH